MGSLYNNANENQIKAITTTDGPLLIIAGPGTGKTFTLVKRVAYLILEKNIKPAEIMVVTFTEKAARELLTRISDEFSNYEDIDVNEMYIGTFHSICLRLLKEYAIGLAEYSNRRIIDDFEQAYLVCKNIESYSHLKDYDKFINIKVGVWKQAEEICKLVNRLMEEMVDTDAMRKDDELDDAVFLAKLVKVYEEMLERNNVMDFAKIQTLSFTLLTKKKEILSKIQESIKYVMVDEYQDTNYIQEKLIFSITEKSHNLCVVGDDDQGMYRFRGATIRNILEFPEKYEEGECKKVYLDKNYRSEPEIIDFYSSWMNEGVETNIFNWNKYRYEKHLKSGIGKRVDGATVFKCIEDDVEKQAEKIELFIQGLFDNGNITDLNQVAFLFKSVKHTRVVGLANALEQRGISVYSPRSDMFFEREEVKQILGCLISCFTDYIGDLKSNAFMPCLSEDMWGYFKSCVKASIQAKKAFPELAKCLEGERAYIDSLKGEGEDNILSIFYKIISVSPFADYIGENKANNRAARNLAEISRLLTKFEHISNMHNISFENNITYARELFNRFFRFLYKDGIGEYEDPSEYAPSGSVSFMTIHQAKGLEFPVVFVGSLYGKPKNQSSKLIDAVEEKYFDKPPYEPSEDIQYFDFWRLYYTAFSRAQNLLVLTDTKPNEKVFGYVLKNLPELEKFGYKGALEKVKSISYKKVYSFTSHIAIYDGCPRQYKLYKEFGYSQNSMRHTSIGTLIHATMENLNKYAIEHSADEIKIELLEEWFESNCILMKQQTGYELSDDEKAKAKCHVLSYFENYKPKIKFAWKSEEEVELIQPDYILQGVVDLIEDYGDYLEILDYKTGRKPDVVNHPEKVDHYKTQMEIYAYLVGRKYKKPVKRMKLYYTSVFEGDPFVVFDYDEVTIERTIENISGTVNKIEQKAFDDAVQNTYVCEYCDFKTYCERKG